jgi:hypothetical protein
MYLWEGVDQYLRNVEAAAHTNEMGVASNATIRTAGRYLQPVI